MNKPLLVLSSLASVDRPVASIISAMIGNVRSSRLRRPQTSIVLITGSVKLARVSSPRRACGKRNICQCLQEVAKPCPPAVPQIADIGEGDGAVWALIGVGD